MIDDSDVFSLNVDNTRIRNGFLPVPAVEFTAALTGVTLGQTYGRARRLLPHLFCRSRSPGTTDRLCGYYAWLGEID